MIKIALSGRKPGGAAKQKSLSFDEKRRQHARVGKSHTSDDCAGAACEDGADDAASTLATDVPADGSPAGAEE